MKKIILFNIFLFILIDLNSQVISTIAGNGSSGFLGDGGAASSSVLNFPIGVYGDANNNIYISDVLNHRVRKINGATGVISTIAGTGASGYNGDGVLATTANISQPSGVCTDVNGNIYLADYGNHRIRKINSSTGIITTIAGTGVNGFFGDGGLATNANLASPSGVFIDLNNNLYIADRSNFRIRKVNLTTGIISTVAGNGISAYAGDGGLATNANFVGPTGVIVDNSGNIFIADNSGLTIRKVDFLSGNISTIAGTGTYGFSGDGGLAINAQLSTSHGVWVDSAGDVYIADSDNHRVRKVNSITGIITTIAGNGATGYAGDGGLAVNATFYNPDGVFVIGSNEVYIADSGNHTIRKFNQCQNTTNSITTTACSQYIAPSGTIHSINEIFNDTIPNATGCDSIITINLTINQNTSSSIIVSECGSYTAPDGQIYNASGVYSCLIQNVSGCDSTITINLTINQNTSSSISPSSCGSYTAPDGQIYTIGGNYSAIIPNVAGCDSTISINLTINPIPIISAGLDQTVCDGISVTLTGSGGAVYTWDNSIVNGVSFIPPVGINEYVVSGMSVNGCFKTDTVIVTVNPLPNVSFTIDETTGCAPLVFNLTNTTLNSLNCTWDISNGDDLIGCGTVTGLLNQVGCHDITLTTTDNNGCLNSFTATNIICVEALPNASFSATPNSFSQPGEQISFTNNSTGASSYSWNFGDSNPISNLVDPTHVFEVGVQDSFIVELIAFSLFGCSDTSFLTIYNTPITDSVDTDIFIPTGFSPNNDNENDTWMVTGLEKYPNTIINVFNRWGQLLFEGGLDNSTWSGIYQGEILPTADYYYIIDLGNGTKFNGVVTLKQ
jgi:gliding motility-associated-like protein